VLNESRATLMYAKPASLVKSGRAASERGRVAGKFLDV
jgi:hypothetical protein